MPKRLKIKILTLALISVLTVFIQGTNVFALEKPSGIEIFGLVKKPLNFTYAELLSFPKVSEVATLKCVDLSWKITFNWTGVPLFHLLTLAQVEPEAYDVVFRATDGYTSSITIEEALKPTTILALKANGTLLSEMHGREGGFRIVVPCKWGYKWVTHVEEVQVIDYDHKGSWENMGFPDEAEMLNCMLPSITPPLQKFDVSFRKREFQVRAFTNVSILTFHFNYLQREINLNTTVPSETTGFANLIIPEDLLKGPYSVLLDGKTVDILEANANELAFLYLTFPEGFHTMKIVGTEFFGVVPKITVEFNKTTYVGEPVIFDASGSVDDGEIITYEWDFGDGVNGNSAVTSHLYTEEGTYEVVLKVTDNDGLSNLATFIVTVEKEQTEDTNTNILSIVTAVIVGALAMILAILLLRRKAETDNEIK